MAIHWQIPFKSLREKAVYTVNIYDSTYSSTPVVLKGGANPFVTEEESDTDEFLPIRTQSGTITFVDDGTDANGNAFDWRTMLPNTDIHRRVTLTKTVGSSQVIVWQGYLQAQNFGSQLYGNPQEKELPVQCGLRVLSAIFVSTTETQLHNFAYLINYIIGSIPGAEYTTVVFQGGADAQTWLLKMFDWQNFLSDDEEGFEPDYNLYEILEDVCRYWGWTARTQGQTVYFTCADDQSEQTFLTLTMAQLATLAGGTAAGTTTGTFNPVTLSGDIFASTANDDYLNRGPNKATVKVDVNAESTIIKFAPKSVEDTMDAGGYSWVQGDEDLVGYFTTPKIYSFDAKTLVGSAGSYGGFCRRQIFSQTEDTDAYMGDMITISHAYNGTALVSLRTKRAMSFSGGSLTIKGQLFQGDQKMEGAADGTLSDQLELRIALGIGPNADGTGAKWWYMSTHTTSSPYSYGWTTTKQKYGVSVQMGEIRGSTASYVPDGGHADANGCYSFQSIPVDNGLSGYLFIEIYGMFLHLGPLWVESDIDHFELGNLTIEFSRDKVYLPVSGSSVLRPREMVDERQTSKLYTSNNANQTQGEWNADCIFASDDNFEYGYGLLMNPDGTYMTTVPYGNTTGRPEQHLADRVTAYWAQSKRSISTEVRANAVAAITPQSKVTMAGTTFHPISISHDWRNDIIRFMLLELPSA